MKKILLLLLAAALLAATKLAAATNITLQSFDGLICDRDRPRQHAEVKTSVCYHDISSGLYHAFFCESKPTDKCYTAVGSLDGECRTLGSRQSMRCGSCTATDAYECVGTQLIWYTNCSRGSGCHLAKEKCGNSYYLPTAKCEPNPAGKYWVDVRNIRPCGTTMVVTRTYIPPPGSMGGGCKEGSSIIVEQAVPSKYCSSGSPNGVDGVSRRLTCHDEAAAADGEELQRQGVILNADEPVPLPFEFSTLKL
jgi:hypothetical protein